jgi:CheY-like chemotaxis protein
MEFETSVPVVVAAVEDMFFSTKIEGAARQAGVSLKLVLDAQQLGDCLKIQVPALIIVDLNSRTCDPIELIRRIKADVSLASVPVIGFFSHVQVELERSARGAGCDQVLARSAFSSKLHKILAECKNR